MNQLHLARGIASASLNLTPSQKVEKKTKKQLIFAK